jgi:ATP-dependent Clp protease ATP-binding subunit ClpC
MFDRFTDRAKKVMNLARQEAQRFNHEYLGTEHVLLGLVQEGSGVAANVLKQMGIDLNKIRVEVEKIVKTGPSMVTMGQLPFTPRAKKVLELSLEEASNLGHNYIGTEHLLLGLIKENERRSSTSSAPRRERKRTRTSASVKAAAAVAAAARARPRPSTPSDAT